MTPRRTAAVLVALLPAPALAGPHKPDYPLPPPDWNYYGLPPGPYLTTCYPFAGWPGYRGAYGGFWTHGPGPHPIDLTDAPAFTAVEGIHVPWDPRPLTVLAAPGRRVAAFVIAFDDPPRPAVDTPKAGHETLPRLRCSMVKMIAGAPLDCALATRVPASGGSKLRLRIPSGGLSVALVWNLAAYRTSIRKGVAGPHGVTLAPHIEPWRN